MELTKVVLEEDIQLPFRLPNKLHTMTLAHLISYMGPSNLSVRTAESRYKNQVTGMFII